MFRHRPDRASLRRVTKRNWLEGAGPDRRAELRTQPGAIAELWARSDVRILGLVEGRLSTEERGDGGLAPRELSPSEAGSVDAAIFLGESGGRPVFAVDSSDPGSHPGWESVTSADLRRDGPRLSEEDAALWAYARALTWWHRRHRFCPVCGEPSQRADAGHRRVCLVCGAEQHPRTDPAVIVLVHEEDRCLLARSPRFPPGMYSTLAGFVEPGESLEDCVRREVFEEVGVRVDDIRYHSSQPWPFPQSLMIGFSARALGSELRLDPAEIEDARWVSREVLADRSRWDGFTVPPSFAIARRLMQAWIDGEPRSRATSR